MTFQVLHVDDVEQDGWYDELRAALKDSEAVIWDLPTSAKPGDVVLFQPSGSEAPLAWGRVLRRRHSKPSEPGRRWCDVGDLSEAPEASWPPYVPGEALPVVRIVDFGGSQQFEQAASAAAENLRALLPGDGTPQVSLEVVRTNAPSVVGEAIAEGAPRLVHVMSHGFVHGQGSHLGSEAGATFSFERLAEHLIDRRHRRGMSIGTSILLLDACDSFRGDFPEQISALADRPLLFVGSTREVGFDEATCYFNSLYASLSMLGLLSPGVPNVVTAGVEAVARADQAYSLLREEPAPFVGRILGGVSQFR